jgi:hypothetical protein
MAKTGEVVTITSKRAALHPKATMTMPIILGRQLERPGPILSRLEAVSRKMRQLLIKRRSHRLQKQREYLHPRRWQKQAAVSEEEQEAAAVPVPVLVA